MSYVHIKISERLLPRLPDKGYARKWVVNGQQNKLKHVLTTKTGNITNQKGYAFNVLAIEEYVNVPSILVCLEMVYTVYLPNVYFHRGNDDKTMDFVVIILFSE